MVEAVRFDDKMVRVQLVCDRAEKDDCRAGTTIKWHGQGDVQLYPERLWPKLAPHPDVWRLMPSVEQEEAEAKARFDAAQALLDKAAADMQRAKDLRAAELTRRAEQDAAIEAQRLQREKDEAAGKGTDVVTATPTADVNGTPAGQAALEALTELTEEEIAALPYEDLQALAITRDYGLHPRLNHANLKVQFLAAQDDAFAAKAAAAKAASA